MRWLASVIFVFFSPRLDFCLWNVSSLYLSLPLSFSIPREYRGSKCIGYYYYYYSIFFPTSCNRRTCAFWLFPFDISSFGRFFFMFLFIHFHFCFQREIISIGRCIINATRYWNAGLLRLDGKPTQINTIIYGLCFPNYIKKKSSKYVIVCLWENYIVKINRLVGHEGWVCRWCGVLSYIYMKANILKVLTDVSTRKTTLTNIECVSYILRLLQYVSFL